MHRRFLESCPCSNAQRSHFYAQSKVLVSYLADKHILIVEMATIHFRSIPSCIFDLHAHLLAFSSDIQSFMIRFQAGYGAEENILKTIPEVVSAFTNVPSKKERWHPKPNLAWTYQQPVDPQIRPL